MEIISVVFEIDFCNQKWQVLFQEAALKLCNSLFKQIEREEEESFWFCSL